MLKLFFPLFVICFINLGAFAQNKNNAATCMDVEVHGRLVTMNKAAEEDDYVLQLFETFGMPSGNLIPFPINVVKGQTYTVNFVANPSFKQLTFVIIDKDNKHLVNKKIKASDGQYYYSYNFQASATGRYIVVVSQKVSGKAEVCGGLSVLHEAE